MLTLRLRLAKPTINISHNNSAKSKYLPVIQIIDENTKLIPSRNNDVMITSPPYLQAQEYIRASKLGLLWLGYSKNAIRQMSKLEIPYRQPIDFEIKSKLYQTFHNNFSNDKVATRVLSSYFTNMLSLIEKASVSCHTLYIFVGSAGLKGTSIPIDEIVVEHLANSNWEHKQTLVDTIVSKALFDYKTNPATGRIDSRMRTEQLVCLSR